MSILLELFDRTVDWHWMSDEENPFSTMVTKGATFEIGDVQYIAGFTPMGDGAMLFGFIANVDGDWRENDTGTGNERAVFGTVMEIIGEFLKTDQPPTLLFGCVPDRANIYGRLFKRREADLNGIGYSIGEPYEDTFPIYGNVFIFPITKTDMA